MVTTVLLSSACTVDKRYEDFLDHQEVEARVSKRWEALIQKDYTASYQYLAKSYRDVISNDEYVKTINPRIIWKKFDIMRARCEDEVCKVNVEVSYRIPPMFGIPKGTGATENVKETWLYQEGEWFYLPPITK